MWQQKFDASNGIGREGKGGGTPMMVRLKKKEGGIIFPFRLFQTQKRSHRHSKEAWVWVTLLHMTRECRPALAQTKGGHWAKGWDAGRTEGGGREGELEDPLHVTG